jgi:BirA family biotin operon repressor/biotin-[acetyl-CoA-carboxylase] ligase
MDVITSYPPNTVIVAEEQTKGRGKQERRWFSEKSNNLYMSLSIRADDSEIDYSNYSFLVAIAVVKALEKLVEKQINLKTKWPNDILVNDKKTGGILLEMDRQKQLLVIGLGLNLDRHPARSETMLFAPTDLLAEGFSLRKDNVLEEFLDYFEIYSSLFSRSGFGPIGDEWIKYAYNFGREITVKINSSSVKGIFRDLRQDGSLLLATEDGEILVRSADIF